MPYFQQCIEDTEWFKDKNLYKAILNLVRSDDVHYIHHHDKQYVLLYYVNLEWRDGWHGETLFYDPYDNDKISFASPYKPGRIILFDGNRLYNYKCGLRNIFRYKTKRSIRSFKYFFLNNQIQSEFKIKKKISNL